MKKKGNNHFKPDGLVMSNQAKRDSNAKKKSGNKLRKRFNPTLNQDRASYISGAFRSALMDFNKTRKANGKGMVHFIGPSH